MSYKKKKILFAAVDIGWRIEHYSKFIKEHFPDQLEAASFVKYYVPKKHYDTNYTYMYNFQKKSVLYGWIISFYIFFISLFKYDIFHFFSGETLLTRKLRRFEFAIYKLFGKKIIMHFVGADIRSPYYIEWKAKNIHNYLKGTNKNKKTQPWQDKLLRDTVKSADAILVSTPDLLELIPQANYYPVVLDVNKFQSELNETPTNEKSSNKVIILHAPSNVNLKGTNIIHKVLKEVEKESNGIVELKLTADNKERSNRLYTVSRYDLFKLYKEADIVIDQLIIGWYGLQAIEALLTKNQVISYVDDNLKPNLYPNCPIQIADANNLKEVVLECIKNHNERKVNFEENITWVKKYHTIEDNNLALIKAWGYHSLE